MGFIYPLVLFLLVVPAALLLQVWYRRQRRIVMPFDHGVQRSGRGVEFLINCGEMLPGIILAVVILLLAGPTQIGEPKVQKALTNIEFCVDVSGSMSARFGEGSRYDASMAAIDQFLDYREGDAFGLTFFGNEVLHWVPLTSDVTAIRCAPPFMNPSNPGHPPWLGGTSIGKALMACRDVLVTREEGDRMIILVSDGFSSDLAGGRDQEIAQELRRDNIAVYGIHISPSEVPGPVVNITSMTGGEVFSPDAPGALDAVFQRIDEMRETRMEKVAAETMDNFVPFSMAGLSVLAISCLCLFGLRYTPW